VIPFPSSTAWSEGKEEVGTPVFDLAAEASDGSGAIGQRGASGSGGQRRGNVVAVFSRRQPSPPAAER
jgi:hypothetical protein